MGKDRAVAAGWGLAEGTFFVIVPDVWLSWLALDSPRRALRAVPSALAGALAGGVLMYAWGRGVPAERTRHLLAKLPAIPPSMIARVEQEVAGGQHRVIFGPLRGIPYKLYARTSGAQRQSLPAFLLWSIPARFPRFVLVPLGAAGLAALGRRAFPRRRPGLEKLVFAAGWIGFYIAYFRFHGKKRS